ncbi:Oidioi.mRNA.OKI2018_I69.chr1.g3894.t1.cds [Oikopleura dioica]|uniref:Oidioi.mRNA.OKI2018_I69.chr1.g3894.t1.cds n=1 Tax=Oikopleura dioica TaxID=34765 RepID=A0ABN7SVM2_OIKDI|nr:Oidioi.mRNA.OKI2018_I69.chr1.g3894.t1.cds [Oikopleura dioica]
MQSELINPVPSQDDVINNQTGLSKKCDPNEWPEDIKIVFNLYRVMVFFWILAGLTWLGGVVSMLTDLLNLSVSYQFDISISRVFRKGRVVFPPIWNLLGSSNSESKYITKNANNRTADGKALYNMNNTKLAYMNKLNYNQLSPYRNRIRLDRSPIDDDNEFYRRIHNSTDIDEQVDLDDFQRRNRKNLTHVPMRITPLSRK